MDSKEIFALRAQIEEVEKKVFLARKLASKDYQSQIDQITNDISLVNGQIQTLQTDLTNTQTTITQNAEALSMLQTQVDNCSSSISSLGTQIESLSSSLGSTNENVSTLSSLLGELQSDLQTASTLISNISTGLGALQLQVAQNTANIASLATVAFSGDYNDLTNKPSGSGGASEEDDYLPEPVINFVENFFDINNLGLGVLGHSFNHKVFFICSPESAIEGNVIIRYNCMSGDVVEKFYINDELIYYRESSIYYADVEISVPFSFQPKKRNNYFYFEISYTTSVATHISSEYTITKAKNLMFLVRDYRQTVFVYKHKYYLSFFRERFEKYKIVDKDTFDFSDPLSAGSTFNKGYCYPKATYTTSSLSIDDTNIYALSRSIGFTGFTAKQIEYGSPASNCKIENYGYGLSYFREPLTTYGGLTVTGIFTEDPYIKVLGYWSGHKTTVTQKHFEPYKLNDEVVEGGIWVENIPVHQLDMDNAPFGTFQGSVAVREDGTCFFFPHYNAYYVLELGFGRVPSCFRQENGDIHVYLGRINHVLKIVLEKNETTNRYEIKSKQKIYGYEEYHETLDNKAIVKINGTYELVDV